MRETVSAAETRRSERWCRAGSRLASHFAQFVPGKGRSKRGGLDRGPTPIKAHSWCGSNGLQASQDDPSIGLLRNTECLPGTSSSEHNPSFRIDYAHPHGGNLPPLAASVNLRHRRSARHASLGVPRQWSGAELRRVRNTVPCRNSAGISHGQLRWRWVSTTTVPVAVSSAIKPRTCSSGRRHGAVGDGATAVAMRVVSVGAVAPV